MKKILFIISGSVAAPKALEAVKILVEKQYQITCVLTKNAEEFISAEECKKITGRNIYQKLFVSQGADEMDHINLSRENDLIVVAPASANIMAKMAGGIADDLASTLLLAADKQIMLAPAMNTKMWENPATIRNIITLYKDGIKFIGPTEGDLACGEVGLGRMKEAEEIIQSIEEYFKYRNLLSGKKILVTSGPTIEEIDPVRYISNHSSGKQGHAIASAFATAGAEVILVSGPVNITPDPQIAKIVKVKTAEEMLHACMDTISNTTLDAAVCAAAVTDWRPTAKHGEKIKKQDYKHKAQVSIELTENPDILYNIANAGKNRPKLVVGFAAETNNVIKNATQKLEGKNLDMVIANNISSKIFGEDENAVTVIDRNNIESWERRSKKKIAEKLAIKIAEKLSSN